MKKKLAVPALAVAVTAAFAVPSVAAVKVRVKDDVFKPGSLTVSKGTKVKWKFVGDNPHNVTVTDGPKRVPLGHARAPASSSRRCARRAPTRSSAPSTPGWT